MTAMEYSQVAWAVGRIEGIVRVGEIGEKEKEEILSALEMIDTAISNAWRREEENKQNDR